MSQQGYTQEQIQELLSNPNVKSCTAKYISYTDDFKFKALELDRKGFLPREIFEEFGFPNYVINTKIPKNMLGRLRLQMKRKGNLGVISNKKGRKIKQKHDLSKMSMQEQNEYLKAEVAYLKELHKQIYGKYP